MDNLHINSPRVIALAREWNITDLQALRQLRAERYLRRNPAMILVTQRDM